MKILLVVNGSAHSDMAISVMEALHLTSRTEVTVLTVVPEHTFLGGITLHRLRGNSGHKDAPPPQALELLQAPVAQLSKRKLKVASLVRWGDPADEILKVSNESDADLVVMGARGSTDPPAFRLSSAAQTVMRYARASVLLVKEKPASDATGQNTGRETAAIKRVLLATDGSKYSDQVSQFLINLPLPRRSEVIIVTALQSHLMAWVKTPTLDFQTNQQLLARLQANEESQAGQITAKAEQQFQTKGYRTATLVIRGGAAESVLAATKEYKPDIVALGSRGLGGIKSLVIGNVAERVARYADCSVLIGREAK